jgi:hypothetical protein
MATPKPVPLRPALRRRSLYHEPVRKLCSVLESQLPFERPCYLLARGGNFALIVPAADGGYQYLHCIRESTFLEARTLGLVRLDDVPAIPAYTRGGGDWAHRTTAEPARTITLTATWTEAPR